MKLTRAEYLIDPNLRLPLPRRVWVDDQARELAGLVEASLGLWNELWPKTFERVPNASSALIRVEQTSGRTWVAMPSTTNSSSIIYCGRDVSLTYWLPHEFGHTLGLRDWVWPTTNREGYINPAVCDESRYSGVMSYCSPHDRWFGLDDKLMMLAVFGRVTPRLRIPGVAQD